MAKRAYEILKKARSIVSTRWTKRSMGEKGGPRCAMGAIFEAGRSSTSEGVRKAQEVLQNVITKSGHNLSIIGFNDAYIRTQEEVVAMFSKAIRAAR